MIRLAWRFICAMARHQWAHWKGWEVFASDSVQDARSVVCGHCRFNEDGQCSVCKCLILSKTIMALEKCPRGYWPRVWVRKKIGRKGQFR